MSGCFSRHARVPPRTAAIKMYESSLKIAECSMRRTAQRSRYGRRKYGPPLCMPEVGVRGRYSDQFEVRCCHGSGWSTPSGVHIEAEISRALAPEVQPTLPQRLKPTPREEPQLHA